jgi:hypothetical protein
VDTALRRGGELSTEIDPLRTQLASFAKHQAGCRARCDSCIRNPIGPPIPCRPCRSCGLLNPLRLTSCSVAWMPTMWSKLVPFSGRKDKSLHVLARH